MEGYEMVEQVDVVFEVHDLMEVVLVILDFEQVTSY
jgi:hypothetical protein